MTALARPFAALAAAVVVLGAPSAARADGPKMKYTGGAATQILNSIKAGDGWCLVSNRQNVKLIPDGNPVDCVRYRVAVAYTASKVPDANGHPEDVVELTFGEETPWIAVELGMPTASGPSLTAAKAANDAVATLDDLIRDLEAAIQKETDPQTIALGKQILAALKDQRAALADLIQKDVEATQKLNPGAARARKALRGKSAGAAKKTSILRTLGAKNRYAR